MAIDMRLFSDYPYYGAYNCDQPNYDVDKPRLKQILWENYDHVVGLDHSGRARPIVLDTVQHALLCRTEYLGYDGFECPHCHNEFLVFHHCHCRLCSSCGVKTQRILATKAEHMCLDVKHRHIVFTIPQEYRNIFRIDRSALNDLFVAARNTICRVVNDNLFRKVLRKRRKSFSISNPIDNHYLLRNFKNKLQFGMIATLHTFGRALNWNPHIHCLVAELVYDPLSDSYKNFNYFNYNSLRQTWQYEVNRLLSKRLGKKFNSLKNTSYKQNEDGFYVYAKDKDENNYSLEADDGKLHTKNVKTCVNYMMRYAARPAMAESRLVSYDKNSNTVSWYYEDHKTEERIDVTEPGEKLVEKLIMHIPDKNFRMNRYYGFYNNKCQELLNHIHELLGNARNRDYSEETRNKKKDMALKKLRFRTMLLDSFNRDILLCPCGSELQYVTSYNPLENIANDREYRQRCIDEMRRMSIPRIPRT